jgi:hypothetical protein
MSTAFPRSIVMMTDFGLHDTYVGQMKGVILSLAPSVQIIDLTHSISPQNIVQGAFFLGKSVPFFPERSIILSVVDPGVGTSRKAIALETEKQIFLAPDNGLLTAIFQTLDIKHCVSITEQRFMLPSQSSTFHGRDVFSPVAAHLASGVSLQELGNALDPADCITIPMPECKSCDNGQSWDGSIIYTDYFGNLVTSLDSKRFDIRKQWLVSAGMRNRIPVVTTYSDVKEQEMLAYTGSSGMIEIAVRNGSAAYTLGLKEGDAVKLSIRS